MIICHMEYPILRPYHTMNLVKVPLPLKTLCQLSNLPDQRQTKIPWCMELLPIPFPCKAFHLQTEILQCDFSIKTMPPFHCVRMLICHMECPASLILHFVVWIQLIDVTSPRAIVEAKKNETVRNPIHNLKGE